MARIGASRVFFDVVGQMQSARLISDTRDMTTMMRALMLDAFEGIGASAEQIFSQVQSAIQAVIDPALELGESQIFFEKFFSFDNAEQYSEQIKEVGMAFAFTGAEALDAGARMAQLGGIFGSPEAVTAGTQAGVAFGLIGGMETEDAMKRLIALAQQTGFLYEGVGKEAFFAMSAEEQRQIVMMNSLRTMDQLNSVENASVATMEQLSTTMDQFAASATIANMSIAEQAALAATLVESGESASKAGRSLRMMLARIGSDTGGAASALHEFGVATQDVNGDMVGLTRIMDQLVEKGYHDLTSAEQAQLAQAVAGRDHYTRFIKLMENHDRVTQLTTVAIERQSSATAELEHFTGNATFAQNQLTAAMETTSAEIGQVLLPAITSAEAVSYGLNAGFLSILETNEELTGVMGGLDKSFAFLGTGISNVGIMANAMYGVAGGVFETFLNIQSLIISVRVYQSILRQSANMENMMAAVAARRLGTQTAVLQPLSQEIVLQDMVAKKISLSKQLTHVSAKLRGQINQELSEEALRRQVIADQQKAAATTGEAALANAKEEAHLTNVSVMYRGQNLQKLRSEEALQRTLLYQDVQRLELMEMKIRKGALDPSDDKVIAEMNALRASIPFRTQEISLLNEAIILKGGYNVETQEMAAKTIGAVNAHRQQTMALLEQFKVLLQTRVATGQMAQEEAELAMASMQAAVGIRQQTNAAAQSVPAIQSLSATTNTLSSTMNRMSGMAGLASMALMFFPNNEDAMQASMILMGASMIGPIISMRTLSAATDRATASLVTYQSVASFGLGLVVIAAAAYGAAKLMKNHRQELDELTDSTIDYMDTVSMGLDDTMYGAPQAAELMLDFGHTTAQGMDAATDSVRDFMSAREELFFGFSPSRMSQTLFDQMVNQGVGELYYRSEINVNNNFFGMTVDEVVDQVESQIVSRITARTG